MSAIIRYLAALHAATSVPEYSSECRVIVNKMIAQAIFVNADPTFAEVLVHLDELDAAQKIATDGPKGAASNRDVKLRVVKSDMRRLKEFVQSIADSNIGESKSIIESAGMDAVQKKNKSKPELQAKYGKVPTTVNLYAKALKKRASYKWQMRNADEAWADVSETIKAETLVTGLTPGAVYSFRFRTLTADGLSDWSMIVTILAH